MAFRQDKQCYFCYLFTTQHNTVHSQCHEGKPCRTSDNKEALCSFTTGGSYDVCIKCLGSYEEFHSYLKYRLRDDVNNYCVVCDIHSRCSTVLTCARHGGDITRYFPLDDNDCSTTAPH